MKSSKILIEAALLIVGITYVIGKHFLMSLFIRSMNFWSVRN